MTSDLEEIFNATMSGIQEEIDEATERLLNCMNNPQFIFFLFDSLTEELLKTKPMIYTFIQIEISNNIQRGWKKEFIEGEPIYWSPEIQENISFALLEAVFSIPNQQRSHFIESLRFIIKQSFPYVSNLIQRLMEIYSQNSADVFNINTYLQIAITYSKVSYLTREKKDIPSEFFEEIELINSEIIASVLDIIPNCFELVTQSEEACVIIYYSVKAVRYSVKRVDELLSDQTFHQILQMILELILIESSDDPILRIKVQIYKMIDKFNSIFLSKIKKRTHIQEEFAIFYRAEIVPGLIESTCQLLEMPMNFQLRTYVLNAFYQFLYFEAYGERIFTPEFLTCVLLTNTRLNDEDENEAETNPYWFVQAQMEIDLINDDYYTPRTFAANIIDQAMEKLNIIDPLYDFFFTDLEDIFDVEAKMFLLYKFLKKLMSLEKSSFKKKDLKNRNKVRPSIKEEDFQVILQLLDNPNPPFLTASLIRICSLVFKYFDPKQGLLLSHQIIMEGEDPIVVYYGSKMFNSCNNDNIDDDEKKLFFESIDIPSLIERLIMISSLFKDNVVPIMISSLCKINAEHLSTFGSELIRVLFELAYSYCIEDSDDGYQGCREIFKTINDIICEIDDDSPFLDQIMNETFEYAIKLLDDFDEESFNSNEELFDILALLNQKMSHTQQSQIEMLDYLLSYWEKMGNEAYYSSRQICLFIYPLITSEDNALSGALDIVQSIVQFTEMLCVLCSEMTNADFNTESGDGREAIGYSLFLASCTIQVFGIVNGTIFLEIAMSMLTPERFDCINKDNTYITIMGSMFVLASFFVIDPQIAESCINDEIVASFINLIDEKNKKYDEPEYITRYREMVVALILLLNFARMGSDQAYHVAAMNIKYLLKFKKIEENGEDDDEEEEEEEASDSQEDEGVSGESKRDDDEEEEEEDSDDTISLLTAPFRVPFDDFDIIQLFKDVSDQTGFFLSLPEELQEEVVDELGLN